jgi:hypothetical protein
MKVAWIGAAALAAGCFSKPGFKGAPDDANRDSNGDGDGTVTGSLVPVTVQGDAVMSPVVIAMEHGSIGIPNAQPLYPNSIRVGGTEILGINGVCGEENQIGSALFPAFSMTAIGSLWPTGTRPISTAMIKSRGPAFGQVLITWTGGKYTCGTLRTTSGSTQLTVFPDGRVIRAESINPTDGQLPLESTNTSCGCGNSNSSYFVTAFVTIANSAFVSGTYRGLTGPITKNLPFIDNGQTLDSDNPAWACFENHGTGSQYAFAIAWDTAPAGIQNGGSRIKLEGNGTVLLYDWLSNVTTVAPGSVSASSAWFLTTGTGAVCDATALDKRSAAFTDPQLLTAGTTANRTIPIMMDSRTGIHALASAPAQRWFVGIDPANQGTLEAGWAISLPFTGTAKPRVLLGAAELLEGTDYLQQSDTQKVFTFWFPTPLSGTPVLTFEQP